jgi:hypothetical protein
MLDAKPDNAIGAGLALAASAVRAAMSGGDPCTLDVGVAPMSSANLRYGERARQGARSSNGKEDAHGNQSVWSYLHAAGGVHDPTRYVRFTEFDGGARDAAKSTVHERAPTAIGSNHRRRCSPVSEPSVPTRADGGPSKITLPPSWPTPGPRSMTDRATTSRLCSMTITVHPDSTSRSSRPIRLSRSCRCSPVVGSSAPQSPSSSQPAAFLMRSAIRFSTAEVSLMTANSVGHISPSSRRASGWKPKVE